MLIAILNNGRFWFGVKIKLGAKSLASYNLAYNLAVIRSKDNKKGTTVNILHLFWKFVIHSALLSNQVFRESKNLLNHIGGHDDSAFCLRRLSRFQSQKRPYLLVASMSWMCCHWALSTIKSRIENLPHQSHFFLWALRNCVIWCYVKER